MLRSQETESLLCSTVLFSEPGPGINTPLCSKVMHQYLIVAIILSKSQSTEEKGRESIPSQGPVRQASNVRPVLRKGKAPSSAHANFCVKMSVAPPDFAGPLKETNYRALSLRVCDHHRNITSGQCQQDSLCKVFSS